MRTKLWTMLPLAILCACGGESSPKTSDAKTEAVAASTVYPQAQVGMSISSIATNPFFQNMYRVYGEVDAAQNSLTLELASADNDQEKQNAQLQDMVNKGAKALVVNLADVKQGQQVMDYWCSKNVPVVYFNRSPGEKNLAACATAYFVDGDVMQAAVFQAVHILQQWKAHPEWDKNKDGKIQYAMIMGLPEHEGSDLRTRWVSQTMETYPKLNVKTEKVLADYGLFQSAKTEELMTAWQKQPEFARVEVVIANNDTMALGALNALEKQGVSLPIFGIDGSKAALEAVKQGRMAGTVFNDFEGQAKTSLRMAANLAAGKDVMDGIENLHMEHKKSDCASAGY